jgi:CYTH domain-containing protein
VAVVSLLVGVVLTICFYKPAQTSEQELLPTQITGGKEIERKWLLDLNSIPVDFEKQAVGTWQIKQTYLNFSPEVRVRDVTDQDNERFFIMTIKSDMSVDGLTRDEKEWYITESEYDHLMTKAEGNTISKTRYRIDRDGLHYEYDIFHDALGGLVYLEIEFTDDKVAWEFPSPEYTVKDVTSDKRYKNQELAQHGIPQD